MASKQLPTTSNSGDDITPVANPAREYARREKAAEFLASHDDTSFTFEEEKAVLRRVDRRILPLLLGAYFLQQLDKSTLRCVPPLPHLPHCAVIRIVTDNFYQKLHVGIRTRRRCSPRREPVLVARQHPLPCPACDAACGCLPSGQVSQRQSHLLCNPALGLLSCNHVCVYKLPFVAGFTVRPRLLRGHDRSLLCCLHTDVVAAWRADTEEQLLERHEWSDSYDWKSLHVWACSHRQRQAL